MALMSALYVGQSGIQTSQNSLNTTAHNLVNIETKGYTRQQILQGSKFYNTVGKSAVSPNQVGLGVDYTKTRQVRDQFLDASFRKESGRSSFYEICAETTGEIQTLLGEMEGASFATSLSDLWTAVQELQKDPASAVTQGTFVSRCSQFLERAQAVYDGLSEYQENLDSRIQNKVDEVNKYAEQIFTLNNKILKNECGEEEANDLRDERNQILDQLSKLVNIKAVDDGRDGIEVYVEGVPLVLDSFVNKMETVVNEAGFINVTWGESYNKANVFNFEQPISSEIGTDIGEIKALVYARGDHRANYTDLVDKEKYNKSEGENISVADSIVMNVQAEFDRLIHKVVTSINDILTGGSADSPKGTMETPETYEMFVRLGTERYDEDGKYIGENTEKSPVDVSTMYTISNLKINPKLLKIPTLNTFVREDGSVDTVKADALSNAFLNERFSDMTLNPNTTATYNFVDYYSAVVGQIGNTGSVYESICQSQEATTTALENKRKEVVGVSSDEELQNMIKFQNAFNASSRYINVINDMLDTIINRLT